MLLGEKAEFQISPLNGGFLELVNNSDFNMSIQDLEECRKNPSEGLKLTIKVVSHEPNDHSGNFLFSRNIILPMTQKFITAMEMKTSADEFFKNSSYKQAIQAYSSIIGFLNLDEGQV